MIKQKLQEVVEQALSKAIEHGELGSLTNCPVPVIIETPKLPEHGDLACGVALKLAPVVKSSPLKIAEIITKHIAVSEENVSHFQVAAPGFINFHLGSGWLSEALRDIHVEKDRYGSSNLGRGEKVLVEYVSANPTGELHIGHGRGAVYGSCLSNLLKFSGFGVEEEFYINDTGEQIALLGGCAWALYRRKLGADVEYPGGGYPQYTLEGFVDDIIKVHGDKLLALDDAEGAQQLGHLVMETILKIQKELLERLRIRFDRWFSERTLHAEDKVSQALAKFAERGYSYESEGALWLKAKELGDERDRVLKKSAGNTTYLAADAAYHLDKYQRGYQRLITIWGADHHGQVPGLKAAVHALGQDPNQLEVILTQIVNLSRDGRSVRMSKREGTVVMLQEVMDEVGVDAVRYYLAESNPQNPINFDLDLAKKTSRENPAFYIQYAHARCSAILRKALEPSVNPDTGAETPSVISQDQWRQYLDAYRTSASVFDAIFEKDREIFVHQKALIMRLESFPAEVEEAASTRTPGRLARYAYELANDLQKFYEVCRVITQDTEVAKARLGLIVATRQVLANVLGIIGVSAPDRM
jgi:arginyl-tRNA synthetase